MKRTAIISAIAIALIAFGLIGIKSFNNSRPSDKEDPLQHNAAINYQNYCAGCHGDNLEKFAVKAWMEEEGSTSAFNSIKFGIVDIGMPAFQNTFTDEEIEALADYVKKGIPEDKSMLKPAVTTDGVIESERQRFVVDLSLIHI